MTAPPGDSAPADGDGRAPAARADTPRSGPRGAPVSGGDEPVTARSVLRLAAPALVVLAAEPLYVLVDTAVVGHLGAVPLAGLAIGGVLLAQVSTALVFLSYGTTARAARLHGAGRREDAVAEGVHATWLALALGFVLVAVGQALAGPVARVLAGDGPVADAAVSWLRVALFGVPFVLVTLAGNGWMRGVQDTVRPMRYVLVGNAISAVLCLLLVHGPGPFPALGLVGSAVANVTAQVLAALLFLRALVVEGVPLRPRPRVVLAQLVLGRDLVLRTLAFQACFLSAASVAARSSAEAAAAHQVVLQLWVFLSLLLDSLAIAAQSLVGAALGSGDAARARAVAARVTRYGLWFGVVLGIAFAALQPVLPRVFTPDATVLGLMPQAWWVFVVLQPIAGVVFALDGVLLGAGDAAFLRTATIASAVVGFLPLVWLSLAFGWGLLGVWLGLGLFMVARLLFVVARARGDAWAVTGARRG